MEITDTMRMDGWSESDDFSHYHTLLKMCSNCQYWTQFEDDPDRTSIMSGPEGEILRCMHCGSISMVNPNSWRSFDFDKKGSKVLMWDPSSCPPTMLGGNTRSSTTSSSRRVN